MVKYYSSWSTLPQDYLKQFMSWRILLIFKPLSEANVVLEIICLLKYIFFNELTINTLGESLLATHFCILGSLEYNPKGGLVGTPTSSPLQVVLPWAFTSSQTYLYFLLSFFLLNTKVLLLIPRVNIRKLTSPDQQGLNFAAGTLMLAPTNAFEDVNKFLKLYKCSST